MFKRLKYSAFIRNTLLTNGYQLDKQLLSLMVFPSRHVDSYGVYEALNNVLTSNNKPSYHFIMKHLSHDASYIVAIMRQLLWENEDASYENVHVYEAAAKVEKYHRWLAAKLSDDGYVTLHEVTIALNCMNIIKQQKGE